MIFCGSSSSFDWPLRNEEGQTRNKLRDAQHRIKVIDKRGFPTGSIKPAMPVSSLSLNLHTFFQLTAFFQKDWGAFYELKRFFSKIMEMKHEAPGAYSNFSDAWSFGQDSAQALPHLNSQMCADNT